MQKNIQKAFLQIVEKILEEILKTEIEQTTTNEILKITINDEEDEENKKKILLIFKKYIFKLVYILKIKILFLFLIILK